MTTLRDAIRRADEQDECIACGLRMPDGVRPVGWVESDLMGLVRILLCPDCVACGYAINRMLAHMLKKSDAG